MPNETAAELAVYAWRIMILLPTCTFAILCMLFAVVRQLALIRRELEKTRPIEVEETEDSYDRPVRTGVKS